MYVLAFFRCGLVMADFSSTGKHPDDIDQFMIPMIIGSSWSIHFFMSHVDIVYRSQVMLGEESITSRTSSQLAGFRARR